MEQSLERYVDLQNPCGIEDYRSGHHGELIEQTACGYLAECSDKSSRRFDRCTRRDAWMFAVSVAGGTPESAEKRELEDAYRLNFGKRILNNDDGEITVLSEKTLDGIVANIMVKADGYLEKARTVRV